MNKLKIKKTNAGFTLVEIIVVIVILAVMVGLTIEGLYVWVNKARMATDLNNAEAIERICLTLNTDEEICRAIKDTSANLYIIWGLEPVKFDETATNLVGRESNYIISHSKQLALDNGGTVYWEGVDMTDETATLICKKIAEKFPEGLPASKTGTNFSLSIDTSPEGILSVKCLAHKVKDGEDWWYNDHDSDIHTEDITD